MMLRKIMSRREGEICKWRCRLIILCLYLILVIYFLSIFRGRQIWRFSSETPLIFVAALHISSPSSLSSSFPFPSSYSPSSSPNLFSFVPSSVSSLSTFPNPINPINFRALSLKSRSSKIMSPQDSAPSSHYSSLLDRGGGGGGGAFQRKFTSRKKNPPSPPSLRMMMKMSAVVEGEKVNGKSVKDWTVDRTLYQALHMATAEELKRDPTVCVIGEDVGHYGGSYKVTKDLHYLHGNFRVMDTPICENTFTGMAIGAAMNGLRPIVEGMNMGFLLLAFNQISNNAGMVKYTSGGNFDVPLVIRGPGGIGKQLGPEHSQRIEAYFQAVPGLKLVACSTPRNARGLLKSAIRENNPVLFFEHVLLYNLKESIPFLPYSTPLDKAEIARPGKDITILSYSLMRHVALEAAEKLAKDFGVDAEVVDLISLKPLDLSTIKRSIQKTHRCLILDESSKTGGIGGEIYAQVIENCSHDLDEIPVRLCTKDVPTPYNRLLEKATIVSPADVVNTVVWMQSARKEELKFNSELMMKTTTTT